VIRSRYARLALTLTGLLLLVGILFAVLTLVATRHSLVEVQQALNRDLASNLVADRSLIREGRLDRDALAQTFHDYMVINPSIEIYLLDMHGRILAYSADPGQVKRNRVTLTPIHRFLAGETSFPLLGDDPRSHDRRKTFSVTPIPVADDPEGYLYVILRGEAFRDLDALIQRSWFLGGAAAVSLLLGLLLGLVLFRLLARRIQRLGDAMDRFRESDCPGVHPSSAVSRGRRRNRSTRAHLPGHGNPHHRPAPGYDRQGRAAPATGRSGFSRPAHAVRVPARLLRDPPDEAGTSRRQ
jgi:hypothetical protein